MSRIIEHPVPIKVGETDFPLSMFVTWLINNCKRFNETGVGLRQGVRIEAAFASAPSILSVDDWDALRESANKPDAEYPIQPARALVPFIDSIDNAKVAS